MKQARLFSISSRVALLGAFAATLILFARISFTHAAGFNHPVPTNNARHVSFTCGSWNIVFSHNPSTLVNSLNGVAAVSANDVWAAGFYKESSTPFANLTLIEHWNGSSWSISPSPNTGTDSFLNGIAASSTSNAWAVGYYEDSKGSHALTEHWDGNSWNIVPNAAPSAALSELFGITVISANDAWAVGDQSVHGIQTLTEHWDGTSWSLVSSPNPGSSQNSLRAVARVKGTSQIWAVGYYYQPKGYIQTLIERWNGTKWHVIASPNPGSGDNELKGVTAISSSDIWAVGFAVNTEGTEQTLIEQWNGSSWSVIASPFYGYLLAATFLSAKNVWAVGYALTEQWNGSSWSIVPSANKGTHPGSLFGVAGISKTGGIWAVGSYPLTKNAEGPSRTLTEFYC